MCDVLLDSLLVVGVYGEMYKKIDKVFGSSLYPVYQVSITLCEVAIIQVEGCSQLRKAASCDGSKAVGALRLLIIGWLLMSSYEVTCMK